MNRATERDNLEFKAVLGAVFRGVPMEEAVTKITGHGADEWLGVVERVATSFAELELAK